MLKHAECFLVVAQQAALRSAVARLLLPLGYRVEIASSEETARQLIGKELFAAAVIAPASLAVRQLAFLREVQGAVRNLVVLAEGANDAKRFAASFPEALVCASQPLEQNKLLSFLNSLTPPKASIHETTSAPELLHFEGCTLDLAGRIFLDANGQEVGLTRAEFGLLVAFVRNPGRVLSRDQLRNAINGRSAEAYDRSIDMLVGRLRRKIEWDAVKPQFIVTVPGTGYKFVPRVQVAQEVPVSPASPTQKHPARYDAQLAERRQLTVLSCQILGFAALAAKLDPEDLEKTISRVYAACAEVIGRFGGTMVHALGDGVLAYFGHPKADENNAQSAARAALELLRAVGNIEAAPIGKFRARIGIATGLMVVGELSPAGTKEPTAVGEALNLALHMQQSAPAGSVVIAASTRDLIGRFFHCREFARVVVEEGYEPAPAWQVLDEIVGMPRFDALRRDGMQEFVGREAEIERLSQYWCNVRRGNGQVVLLTGEAGIGKSRLAIELEERLRSEPHTTFKYSGSQHRSDAPMSVLLDELQISAGFAPEDAPADKLEKLRRYFDAYGHATGEATALISGLFSLPCEVPPDIKQLSPQKRKERTFTALLARIISMASKQPVLAVVEDVHWVDPTSLEFLALVVERARMLRLLLVVIGRPEFAPPWPEHSYVTTLSLSRLSRSDAATLVHEVAGECRISSSAEAEIVTRADGVPLFIEELTKSVLENSANSGDIGSLRAQRAAPIPTTLQGLLLARFDRLECGKEVAQASAVIGREFSFELLSMVTGMDEPALVSALDELVSSGLVFRRGPAPQATFIFKHALVRDAAYDMLLRAHRQRLHAEVARTYEEQFPETAEARPEFLAYHFREAGNPIKSISYLLAGAERALLRSASAEALSNVAQARELIVALPESSERLQLELKLEITLARALLATRGYTAQETREAYRRARQHCEALSDQASLPLIIHGQWLSEWQAADHQSALEQARQLYLWGERNGDAVGLAVAHTDFGITFTTLGRLDEARGHLDQALQIDRYVLPGRQPFVASDADGRNSALSFMHHCLLLLGFPDQAERRAGEAAELKPDNLYSRALAQMRMSRMRVFARDARATAEIGLAVLRLSEEQGYPHMAATASIYTGWALVQRGDAAGGIEMCQQGMAQLRTLGVKCWLPLHLALLAECYEQAGDTERAVRVLTEALQSVDASGERFWEAEIYRLKGKFLLRGGRDADVAQTCFVNALATARRQEAKLLELRAAASLADLLKRKRAPAQAREALAPVYASFTEGFDCIDLSEAKALLDTLADQ